MKLYLDDSFLDFGDSQFFLREAFHIGIFVSNAYLKCELFKDGNKINTTNPNLQYHILKLPPDIRSNIREFLFGNRYMRCWRPNRQTKIEEVYINLETAVIFKDASVAEASEVKLGMPIEHVTAFVDERSLIAPLQSARMNRASDRQQCLLHICTKRENWILKLRDAGTLHDPTSGNYPLDSQTALELQPHIFERTDKRHGKDQCYRHRTTGNMYYVDRAHRQGEAHLEVFGPNERHLGEADLLTAELKPGTADTNKRLTLS